ncbi:MAG: membrane or secreted protein [Flavobacteriaceae bacterium]|nr:membrane or secreted protein [Flavobacteriaceae bacterium]
MKLFIISIILLGIGFAGIAMKIWAKKDGKFGGTCASQSPFLNKDGEACGFCGKLPEQCENNSENKQEAVIEIKKIS